MKDVYGTDRPCLKCLKMAFKPGISFLFSISHGTSEDSSSKTSVGRRDWIEKFGLLLGFVFIYYLDGLFKTINSAANKLQVINSSYSQLVISGMIRNFAMLFKFQI